VEIALIGVTASAALIWCGWKAKSRRAINLDSVPDQMGMAVVLIAALLILSHLGPVALKAVGLAAR
jgi:hypothetical protein